MLIGVIENDVGSKKPQTRLIDTEFMGRFSVASAASRQVRG
jgi:hypothetical protein